MQVQLGSTILRYVELVRSGLHFEPRKTPAKSSCNYQANDHYYTWISRDCIAILVEEDRNCFVESCSNTKPSFPTGISQSLSNLGKLMVKILLLVGKEIL